MTPTACPQPPPADGAKAVRALAEAILHEHAATRARSLAEHVATRGLCEDIKGARISGASHSITQLIRSVLPRRPATRSSARVFSCANQQGRTATVHGFDSVELRTYFVLSPATRQSDVRRSVSSLLHPAPHLVSHRRKLSAHQHGLSLVLRAELHARALELRA